MSSSARSSSCPKLNKQGGERGGEWMGRKGGHQKPPRYCRKAWLAFFIQGLFWGQVLSGCSKGFGRSNRPFTPLGSRQRTAGLFPLGWLAGLVHAATPPSLRS